MSIKIERSSASYRWEGRVPLLFISEEEISLLTEHLVHQLIQADFQPQLVVSIAQSGVTLGEALSKIFDLPHAIFRARAYSSSKKNNQEGKARHVLVAKNSLLIDINNKLIELPVNLTPYYKRILVVDHLIDSGDSIKAVINSLHNRHVGNYYIHTACLWLKSCANFQPNYFGALVELEPESGKMPWIVEPKDVMIHELRKKFITDK